MTEQRKKTTVVVEEGGLEFVTPGGRVLASLGALSNGGSYVELPGADGRHNVRLETGPEGSAVTLRSEQTNARVSLFAGRDRSVVTFMDASGMATARVACGDGTGGIVSVARSSGELSACLGATENGGILNVFGPNGTAAVSVFGSPEGGNVSACNADGKPVATLGADQGDGGIVVNDRQGVTTFAVPVWKVTRKPLGQA